MNSPFEAYRALKMSKIQRGISLTKGDASGSVFSSLGRVDVSEWALDIDTDGDGVVSVEEARHGFAKKFGVAVEDVTEVSSARGPFR